MIFHKLSNNTIRSLRYITFSLYCWFSALPIKMATSAFDPLAFFLHEPCNILCHVHVNHRWRLHINSRVPRDRVGHFEYCHLVGENVHFIILIGKIWGKRVVFRCHHCTCWWPKTSRDIGWNGDHLVKIRYIYETNVWKVNYSEPIYRQVSNISITLVGNKIVDHSDAVGASPVGAAPPTSSSSTGCIGLGEDNCTTRRETSKFGVLVRLILEILRYLVKGMICYGLITWVSFY